MDRSKPTIEGLQFSMYIHTSKKLGNDNLYTIIREKSELLRELGGIIDET